MSLKSFNEKLNELKGEYVFDFANDDDCSYVFAEYGGEETMKKQFPQIYDCLMKAKEKSRVAADKAKKSVMVTSPTLKLCGETGADKTAYLESFVGCRLLDTSKEVCDDEQADKWNGISVQVKIRDVSSSEYVLDQHFYVADVDGYYGTLKTANDLYSNYDCKKYELIFEVTGVDPLGILNKVRLRNEFSFGEVVDYDIINVTVEDPSYKQGDSNKIIMLYGRTSQQFSNPDYVGGDYLSNSFSQATGTVHFLMPVNGTITYNKGISPIGLKEPTYSDDYVWPKASYDGKQLLQYRPEMTDKDIYDSIKDNFVCSAYKSSANSTMEFSFTAKGPDDGRSKLDWYDDVRGTLDGSPKTIYLDAYFVVCSERAVNPLTVDENQIKIKSLDSDTLKQLGYNYYEYNASINTVFIPPITIHWGCFAKDVAIELYDGGQKRASEIVKGDVLKGFGGRKLTVEDIVTGEDKVIYLIDTKSGDSIKVSGGHPMKSGGKPVRAHKLKAGDLLDKPDGSTAEITAVRVEEYNDTVYNFTFVDEELGNYIIANGFYSGDLKLQNTPVKTNAVRSPESVSLSKKLAEEAERFIAMKKSRKI